MSNYEFESVAVTVPQWWRTGERFPNIHVLGFSLVSGEADITQIPSLPDLDPASNDRIIRYIRTAARILRIDPDGRVWRLKLDIPNSRPEAQGYLQWADPIRLHRSSELTLGINDGRPIGYALPANVFSGYGLAPVEQVLYRTSRLIPEDWVSKPTDTALRFAVPQDFQK